MLPSFIRSWVTGDRSGDRGINFRQLNAGWNANNGAPHPHVALCGSTIELHFLMTLGAGIVAGDDEAGCLTFVGCSRWRLGSPNDEGWYLGQCRYSKIAPRWGEFYEITGRDSLRDMPDDWHELADAGEGYRHFLFYLKDETFECIAADWSFRHVAATADASRHDRSVNVINSVRY
ncbi:hypothetical protein [Rhizobium sp. RU36D]|uniref:hypothetical protein n=1 Tax=Rhizobium sp. RU36D TaxID=1907415 RepID=UPI0009D848E4|nr:hypothetical protein [Rhizobium sp. RU36D]SMC43342.1 hypothetical protein SAMN05880593_101303 [Rhizobium sp. RU36D]